MRCVPQKCKRGGLQTQAQCPGLTRYAALSGLYLPLSTPPCNDVWRFNL